MITTYPDVPGFKERNGTSQEAAEAEQPRAETLRRMVMASLFRRPQTADEVAGSLGENILSIRPRLSELRKMGKIEATGVRRKNRSGHSAAEWMPVFMARQPDLF